MTSSGNAVDTTTADHIKSLESHLKASISSNLVWSSSTPGLGSTAVGALGSNDTSSKANGKAIVASVTAPVEERNSDVGNMDVEEPILPVEQPAHGDGESPSSSSMSQ